MDETAPGHTLVRTALAQLDINLIVNLDALLTERNVTRAAERLHLSQPAMSAALARLRAHFDDPLLVRHGRSHELSPLAIRLAAPVAELVDRLHGVFTMSPAFDPASESREFIIHCSDHSSTVVGAIVRRLAGEAAPGVRLRFVHREVGVDESPGSLLARSDGALLPHGVLSESPHLDVFEDRWVCIVSEENTAVGPTLSLENLATLPWVVTHHAPPAELVIEPELRRFGIHPHVGTVVNGFLSVPYFVSSTNAIAVVQQRLAERIPPSLGVRVVPTPFDIEAHAVALWWHPSRSDEPAHRWLRQLFAEASHVVAPLTW